ncbi:MULTISPECIES: hypothetical protein [Escherichia]|uniref:hypothetical protein n=1 Tax=Escherichia TaxID=561 RepID=UPI001365CD6C|nr:MULTISPECIES: hypothetical protein [Escherichia]EFS7178555.1 hypothetical protein [Escherichia coli]EGF1626147.1 hypothetical protein [Escherichia coli]EIK8055891.1 hypothetical protein [Escherichia coli]EKR5145417.1 hypothetical protein [Escherichia coli]ELO4849936.1 hypothetical protein [Escherichia coli]
MMISQNGNAVNTPDLSRLYIISGRMMFDDEDEVMLIEADSSCEAEAAFRQCITEGEAHMEQALVISSASLQSLLPDRLIASSLKHTV